MTNDTTYLTATGKIDYNMTNDYMFRVILQENKTVLKGLICSLLHFENESIKSVEVKNPIKLGDNISEKTYILDVNILLNDDTILNLEMQMQDLSNWTDRALCYTCRNFTHLQKGHDYTECQSVIHIGFLNYTLFPKYPEFYATYMIANEKPELLEATKSLYEYNNEDTIRFQCYAREDYIKQMNTIRRDKLELTTKLKELTSQNEELTSQVAEKDACIKEKDAYIKEIENYIKELETKLAK